MCTLVADFSLPEVLNPDVIIIPGGLGTEDLMQNPNCLTGLEKTHKVSQWTTSVCTGSLLLASAGLLKDKEATSHWTELERLRYFGSDPFIKTRSQSR